MLFRSGQPYPRLYQALDGLLAAVEAEPYVGKLLPLPRFIVEGGTASWPEILDGLALTGHFLLRDLVTDRSAPVAESRNRLCERLRKAAGQA